MQTQHDYITHQPAIYKQPPTAYTHRRNSDGTTDSVCRRCYVTVVTACREADLDCAEHNHHCDPKVFDSWNDMIERGKRPRLQ